MKIEIVYTLLPTLQTESHKVTVIEKEAQRRQKLIFSITFRVTETEYESIKACAMQSGITVSEYIRTKLFDIGSQHR
jgi:predicted DNA binding CopG/RHH family protein